ncbi:phosphate ABC transporter substrate-binding protein PstS [Bacteriovorax sp. Seq25_V]|uniref:phosphate ABC transporter substrate-binding protein PstS n=1 Tax=Bacteriovorax sp. Seq25_V TaxID=1201288 RepID=UPI00038A3999|nr:phosphate ABC transporter substrate-binding protein PstS [Bacteriovorax sp. Seq25_V]EQC45670.1 phosphate ABC transporter, phosphate-binding protein PstS [Bacteriovorax sp. Seq25_V]
MKKLLLSVLALFSVQALAITKINGAGASFPYAIYSKWFSEYSKIHSTIQFNYQPIGSGGGIRQFVSETVDFGASDAILNEKDRAKAKHKVMHIPTVLGAVAVSYNVSEINNGIKLDGQTLANIYLGKINKWNDAAIVKLNPTLNLPAKDILVVRRADGSGTTSIFTEYLSAVSAEWENKVGTGKSVRWVTGVGAKGNDGVTALIKQTDGTIGYIDLAHAQKNNLSVAALKNKNGEFIIPDVNAVSLAAANFKRAGDDFTGSIINAAGSGAYPVSAFTYLLISLKEKDSIQTEIHKFIKWALTDGQKYAQPLFYAPLPKNLSSDVLEAVNKL